MVLPTWLSRASSVGPRSDRARNTSCPATRAEFQFSGPVSTFVGDSDDPIKVEEHLAVILGRQICNTCNNVWMNQLEERVRPFFHEMLLNHGSIQLDTRMQRDFARWATIKAFLIEKGRSNSDLRVLRAIEGYSGSDVELAWLAENDDPLPRSRVWRGAFDAKNIVALSHRVALSVSPAGTAPHVTTITWGYTVFQVFSSRLRRRRRATGDEYFPLDPPPPLNAAINRVWPSVDPSVSWPGEAFVARSASTRSSPGWPPRSPCGRVAPGGA